MNKIKGHQGDVIFTMINELPTEAVEVKNKPIALGEINGHAHVLTGNVKRYEHNKRLFYVVLGVDAILQHTRIENMNEDTFTSTKVFPVCDHKPHRLPAGIYEFWIQNSYNPYKKIMEAVKD